MTDDTIARTSKERSPADYAIEHGQYLAKSAEDFLTLLNDVAMAESALETWDEDDSEYAAAKARVDEAWEKRHDHWQGLQNAIYEFRKRAERVAPETNEVAKLKEVLGAVRDHGCNECVECSVAITKLIGPPAQKASAGSDELNGESPRAGASVGQPSGPVGASENGNPQA